MLKKRNLRIFLVLGIILILICPNVVSHVDLATTTKKDRNLKLNSSKYTYSYEDDIELPENAPEEAKTWNKMQWLAFVLDYYNISDFYSLDEDQRHTLEFFAEAMVKYCRGIYSRADLDEIFSDIHSSGYVYSAYYFDHPGFLTPRVPLHNTDLLSNTDECLEVRFLATTKWGWEYITQVHAHVREDKLSYHVAAIGYTWEYGLFENNQYETTDYYLEPRYFDDWTHMDVKGMWAGQYYDGIPGWKGSGREIIMQAKVAPEFTSQNAEILIQVVWGWWDIFGTGHFRVDNNYFYKTSTEQPNFPKFYLYYPIEIIDDDPYAPVCIHTNAKYDEPYILFGDVPFQHDTIWIDDPPQSEPVQARIQYSFINFRDQVIIPWEERGFTWIDSNGRRVFSCDIPIGLDTYGYHYLWYTVFDNDQDKDPDGITNPLLNGIPIDSLSGDRARLDHIFVVAKYRTDISINVSIVPAIWNGQNYVENTEITAPYTFHYAEPFFVKIDITYPSNLNILIYDLWFEIDSPSLKTSFGTRNNPRGTFQLDGTGVIGGEITTSIFFTKWGGLDPPNVVYKLTTEYYREGTEEPEQEFDELKIWNWFEDGEWGIENIPTLDYDTHDTFEIQIFAKYSFNISSGWSDPWEVSNDYIDYPVYYDFIVDDYKRICIDQINDIKRKWEANSFWDTLLTVIGIAISTAIGAITESPWTGVGFDIGWDVITNIILEGDRNTLRQAFNVLKPAARCPLDFEYETLYEPVFNYSILLEIPDYPDADQTLLELYEEDIRHHIELTEYYNALYITFNRLSTAELYAPEFLSLQQEGYENFRTKIMQLESETFEIRQGIFARMEIINPEYNLIDLFQDFTAGDLLNLLIEDRKKINDSTLDPELKEYYYNLYTDLLSTYPQENLDDTLHDLIIKDEYPESFSLPLDTEYLTIMNYPENEDSPTIEDIDYSQIVPYDTETTISFFVDDTDGIANIQLIGANVTEPNIDFDEATQNAFISFKLQKYGENELTLVITDNHPNINRSTFQKIIIFVDDGNAPQISLIDKTLDPIYDSTLNSNYTFLITDLTLANVIICQNDLEIFNGLKHFLTVDLPSRSGIYEYEIFATDAVGNTNETTFIVEIFDDDTTPPTVEFNPSGDLTDGDVYELSNQIEIIINDPLGAIDITSSGISLINYTLDSGPMTSLAVSDSPLQYSFFINIPNILGEHNITIVVFDSDNENEYDHQGVTVEHIFSITDDDEDPPKILSIVAPVEVGVTDPTFNVDLEMYDYSGIFKIDCYIKILDGSDEIYHLFTDIDIPDEPFIFKSYVIPMETSNYSLYEKEFEVIFIVTDNDIDRFDDALETDPISVIIKSDDDITPPEIVVSPFDYNTFSWQVKIIDDDGEIDSAATALYKVFDESSNTIIQGEILEECISETISLSFKTGIYILLIEATNNDNDREDDEEFSFFEESVEINLFNLYNYVDWQLEELKIFTKENTWYKVSRYLNKKFCQAQDYLYTAFNYTETGDITCGLCYDSLAKLYIEIAEHKIGIYIKLGWINDDIALQILYSLHDIRDNIVYIKGESTGIEITIDISCIEVNLFNLIDFIEENVNSKYYMSLISKIKVAAELLELSIVFISLEEDPMGLLCYAQCKLEQAIYKIDQLLKKERISQELADHLIEILTELIEGIEAIKEEIPMD